MQNTRLVAIVLSRAVARGLAWILAWVLTSALACGLGLALLGAAAAQAQWQEDGQQANESAWRKSDGDFGAMLLVTDQLQAFLEQWNRPPSPDYQPNISTADEAPRGGTVAAVVLFHGCAAGEQGTCRSVADFRVLRPDGSVYFAHENAPIWQDLPPARGAIQLGLAKLAFQVKDDDPLGEYTIETTVRDEVKDRTVVLTQPVRVVEALPADKADDGAGVGE